METGSAPIRLFNLEQAATYIGLGETLSKAYLKEIGARRKMNELQNNMVALMRDVTMSEIRHTTRITTEYKPQSEMELPQWIF